jgi:hypothetical protein
MSRAERFLTAMTRRVIIPIADTSMRPKPLRAFGDEMHALEDSVAPVCEANIFLQAPIPMPPLFDT